MKKLLIFTGLMITVNVLVAQQDSVTTRNLIEFDYRIKHTLIPEYERLLNFIADKTTAPNEVDDAIKNKVKGNRDGRIFTNDKVIIENDLKPGADTSSVLRGDLDVVQYLNNFNTSYTKTEDKSISLVISGVSPIKKTSYLYFNVLMECTYYSTNTSGEKWKTFQRIAEIRLVSDSTWYLYINSIYFPKGTEMDSTNVFTQVVKTETDVEKILAAYDDAEKRRVREETNKIQVLIEDGDDKFDNGDFQEALGLYKEARKLNLFNKEPLAKINKAKDAIAKQNQEKQAKEERRKHVIEMKEEAVRAWKNYDFKLAKLLCDSLIKDYNESDSRIDSLNEEMTEISAALMGIETAMEHKDLKEAVKNCEKKIAESKSKNKIYQAEMNYRMALIYFTLDKSESRKIFDYSGQAIELSGKRHQEALKIRVQMYLNSGEKEDISHAVEDATYIINNDSRNPDLFAFRAMIYEKDKNSPKAIEDYGKAILYKTSDSTVFLKKTILEFTSGLFKDVVKTTTDGISKTSCYGMLYYYRTLAKEKSADFKGAGDDFRQAKACSLGEPEKKVVNDLSLSWINGSTPIYAQGSYQKAADEYTKSILLDSNDHALYMRGKCYISLGKNESAIADLSALLAKNDTFRDAYSQRGIAYTRLGKYKEADADFESELRHYYNNALAHYAKGISLMHQKDYDAAAVSFVQSGTLVFSDSAYYMASLAYYTNRSYTKAIDNSMNARKKDTKKFEVYYIAGKAFYDIGRFSEAAKEFEKAKKLVIYNDDLYFWHGAALEAGKEYLSAAQAFEQLTGSPEYKDTATYRSAICLMKTRKQENYQLASNKFVRYILSDRNPDKSESNAWTAYSLMSTTSAENADKYIDAAKKSNEENPMVQYALACLNTKNSKFDDALSNLEKALAGLKLEKDFYSEEPLLKDLRKNSVSKEKFGKLMEKYFK